jgi:hypothetical protein
MATNRKQVRLFLREFKEKKSIWTILFRDERGKNSQSLADLEMRSVDREKVIDSIAEEDYSEGPLQDTLYKGSDMWVFGKNYKGKEIYIKISMGLTGGQVICISFHSAKHKMNYPLKTVEK